MEEGEAAVGIRNEGKASECSGKRGRVLTPVVGDKGESVSRDGSEEDWYGREIYGIVCEDGWHV